MELEKQEQAGKGDQTVLQIFLRSPGCQELITHLNKSKYQQNQDQKENQTLATFSIGSLYSITH
ncbi:MAG: hypothetical protein FH756_19560 [Firmicutes bacterium]|nr:hypothetical protein [Bacillota bacterium]